MSPAPFPPSDDAESRQHAEQQAWAWLRKLNSGGASHDDLHDFRQWIQSKPLHFQAYQVVRPQWDALRQASQMKSVALDQRTAAFRHRRQRRRAVLVSGGFSLGLLGLAALNPPLDLWPAASEWSAHYRTAAGEQQSLSLEPGIDVVLNTRTSVRRDTEHGRIVGLHLMSGEAAIELDQARSLKVYAGAGHARGEAAHFDVRHVNGLTCVTCLQGQVQIFHPLGERLVDAGEQLDYSAGHLGRAQRSDPEQQAAWRKGVLLFRDHTLEQVIDEINRYRQGKVMLMNDSLRSLLVSGRFYTHDLEQALQQLEYSFDLKARQLPGHILLLS